MDSRRSKSSRTQGPGEGGKGGGGRSNSPDKILPFPFLSCPVLSSIVSRKLDRIVAGDDLKRPRSDATLLKTKGREGFRGGLVVEGGKRFAAGPEPTTNPPPSRRNTL